MGFKIKNSLTGEFEKLPILTLKGEKGETGGVEEYNKVDYMGNKYETLKQANDANVEYAVKTAIGEFNYLDYDGQHITALDSIAGQAKNAVVEGQTLVNLHRKQEYRVRTSEETQQANKFENIVEGNNHISCNMVDGNMYGWGSYIDLGSINVDMLKPNTKYLVWFELATVPAKYSVSFRDKSSANSLGEAHDIPKGQNYAILTTADEIIKSSQILYISFHQGDVGYYEFKNAMIIPYQEEMENWDIPYFEGMASVKAPVLKSVGKNFYAYGDSTINNPLTDRWYYTNGKTSSFGSSCKRTDGGNWFYLEKGIYSYNSINENALTNIVLIGEGEMVCNSGKEIPSGWYVFRFKTKSEPVDYVKISQIQLEQGTQKTPYEPYKSNTLSTPEDLELRGIGDVKDELNISTGEKVERISEVVLDGSSDENWFLADEDGYTYKRFRTDCLREKMLYSGESVCNIICDKVVCYPNSTWKDDREGIEQDNIYLSFRKNCETITEFKQYLSQNPITIQYALATPVVKTVDLSDNAVYSYKGTTHYDCSSAEDSLVPTLSVKVPTDLQATIAQQRETIQTLNSENKRLNQIQEALKASMLDSQVQLMNLIWDTDFEVFTLRESIAPKDSLMDSRTGSNIDKFSQAKFIIENDCPDLEKLNSQIEYYFSKDVFSQEQFEELTDLISIVKGENGCEY